MLALVVRRLTQGPIASVVRRNSSNVGLFGIKKLKEAKDFEHLTSAAISNINSIRGILDSSTEEELSTTDTLLLLDAISNELCKVSSV